MSLPQIFSQTWDVEEYTQKTHHSVPRYSYRLVQKVLVQKVPVIYPVDYTNTCTSTSTGTQVRRTVLVYLITRRKKIGEVQEGKTRE